MWERIFTILRKEFRSVFRDPRMRMVIFGVPVLQTLIFGYAVTMDVRHVRLVVVDRGHPRVPDPNGVIRDEDCPPVEINTTALVSNPAARGMAKASQRYVYSDYRLVEFSGRRNAAESTAQLAAEIVLRTSTW